MLLVWLVAGCTCLRVMYIRVSKGSSGNLEAWALPAGCIVCTLRSHCVCGMRKLYLFHTSAGVIQGLRLLSCSSVLRRQQKAVHALQACLGLEPALRQSLLAAAGAMCNTIARDASGGVHLLFASLLVPADWLAHALQQCAASCSCNQQGYASDHPLLSTELILQLALVAHSSPSCLNTAVD
jgi:hypothetical protein